MQLLLPLLPLRFCWAMRLDITRCASVRERTDVGRIVLSVIEAKTDKIKYCVSAISNEQWNRHDRNCREAKTGTTDSANGDDNYAIISFIFVGTSKLLHSIYSTTVYRIAHRPYTVLWRSPIQFPIVYWITLPSRRHCTTVVVNLIVLWFVGERQLNWKEAKRRSSAHNSRPKRRRSNTKK